MFGQLFENLEMIQGGVALLQKAGQLDADKNGVLDKVQHQQYIAEEVSLANALREVIAKHSALIEADLKELGLFDKLNEAKAEAEKAEAKPEAPAKPEKKGK